MSNKVLVLLGSIGRSQSLADAIGRIAESGKFEKQGSKKLVGSRSFKNLSTLGRLGLEGLLLFMYSNFIL